ncbi:putative transcription factor interactor and regulator CCHC(Zn) family [Helianthus annuus]|nr:putative transcription factor interactor and regulator CCHC(Zn) family [Helianthus annuus]
MSTTNSELSALTQQQELDSKLGTTTRIPRLTDANDFPEWKWRFEQHLKVKDYKLWRSILRGPREIMMESPTEPEVKVKKPRDQYTEDDLLIVEEDDRALSYLTMGLGPNIAMGFRTCKSAKELWDSLVEVYEGNEDMKESRRNLLQQNFNNFNHIYGETVDNQIQRFVKLVTQMQMEEIHTTNASTNRQLLNALPKSWDHHVAMIKKTKDLARCTLSEMISHIKACELDDKQRETNYKNSMLAAGFSIAPTASSDSNTALLSQGGFQMFRNTKPAPTSANVYNSGSSTQASPASAGKTSAAPSVSVASNEMVAFFSRQSKENLEIAASVINCMNAFASGNLDPPKFSMDDLDQIHPEDVEEMDITWQMAMAAFRAKNFVRKTGKNKWQNLKFTGPVKMPFEYRCYNCHEQGHLARNCTKPKVNDEQTPAQPAAPVTPNRERALVTTTGVPADSVNSGSPQVGLAQALVVQPDSPFDWSSEIERLNISAPENQATPSNIAFMASNASVSDDVKAAQEEESSAENFAFMTQILSAPVKGLTKEEVLSVFCTSECRERVEAYRIHNAELIEDYNEIKRKNFTLTKNEKLFKEKIEAQRKDIVQLKDDVSVATAQLIMVKEKLCEVTKELENVRDKYQINELNIKKFDSSSKLVKNLCDQQLAYSKKKGSGLGYNQAPPPYNNNYTYLPMTEEEMLNESKMTYGPKNNKPSVNVESSKNSKSSINGKFTEEQVKSETCFVSKGTFDPNSSSSCADKVPEVIWGDVFGSEQVLESDSSKTSFDDTNSDCVFGQAFLNSFHSYVSSSFGPDVLGKTVNACDELFKTACDDDCFETAESCDSDISDSLGENSVTNDVPQNTSSETTDDASQENQSHTDFSCESNSVNISTDESEGTSLDDNDRKESKFVDDVSASIETETQNDLQKEKEVFLNENLKENDCEENHKSTPENSNQNDFHEAVKNEKSNFSDSHACASASSDSDPQVSTSSGKAQASKSKQNKQAPSTRPKRPAASVNRQKSSAVKRQICFNCGIAGHIARNCVSPSSSVQSKTKHAQHQKVKPNRSGPSKSMTTHQSKTMKNDHRKVKPSDQDWNAAKRRHKNQQNHFSENRFQAFGNYANNWSKQYWKPKPKAKHSNLPHTLHNNSVNANLSKFLNKDNLIWQRVTYFDAQGKPRSTMGWVPKSN